MVRAVNLYVRGYAFRIDYKDQPRNAGWGNNRCLFIVSVQNISLSTRVRISVLYLFCFRLILPTPCYTFRSYCMRCPLFA